MPTFDVVVSRYQLAGFFIEAKTEEEAKKIALDKLMFEVLENDAAWDNDECDIVSVDPIAEKLLRRYRKRP